MEYRISEFAQDLLEDIRGFCIREVRMQAAREDRMQAAGEPHAQAVGAGHTQLAGAGGEPDGGVIEKIREIGFTGIFASLGEDLPDLTLQEQAALLGELASHDAGAAISAAAADLAAQPVKMAGTEEQKRVCMDVLENGGFGAFCLTEELSGSDISTIRTRARRDGSGYILSGSKAMITNFLGAEFLTVFAVLDDEMAAFLVPAEAEGIMRGEPEQKLGLRTSETGSIWFNDVGVPESALVGGPGRGKKLAAEALNIGRMHCGAVAIGVAERALEETIGRIRERTGFDRPLSDNPVIRSMLAEMYMQKEAAKGTLIHALENYDLHGSEDRELLASAAKCLASDAAVKCAMEAVQLFGGYGYCQDYPAEKLLRDAKAFQIIEGANEIQKMIIGKKLVRA